MIDSLIIYFIVYAFIGYLCEVAYCSVSSRRFVNRGFLYGPWLPIYGFGGLIVVICLDPLASYPILVFVSAFFVTSLLEYFTSWLLEKLFSVKLWDYSKAKVNINGRVCLRNSFLFALLGIAAEYFIQPFMEDIVESIPLEYLHPTAMFLSVLFAIDTTFSVMKMSSFKEGLRRIRKYKAENEERITALIKEGRAELAAEIRARVDKELDALRTSFVLKAGHIIDANPSLTAKGEEVKAQLEILGTWMKSRKELKKKYKAELRALDEENSDKLRRAGR